MAVKFAIPQRWRCSLARILARNEKRHLLQRRFTTLDESASNEAIQCKHNKKSSYGINNNNKFLGGFQPWLTKGLPLAQCRA
jgi:hypothetical protein